jgi:hypothetical protein
MRAVGCECAEQGEKVEEQTHGGEGLPRAPIDASARRAAESKKRREA